MRKQFINSTGEPGIPGTSGAWLNLEGIADVEVTSEDPNFPVERIFSGASGAGWKADGPGPQVIRLLFARPQIIKRIRLEFSETVMERSQEFVLRWRQEGSTAVREILRQQWNFSPSGSTREVENLFVNLEQVVMLEVAIDPDRGAKKAVASLDHWMCEGGN